MRGRIGRAARLHVEVLAAAAVRVQDSVLYAVAFGRRLQQHGCRAVPEDRAGVAVFVVDDRRHFVGADHDHFFMRTGFDVFGSRVQCKQEAAAGCGQVEPERLFHPGLVTDQIGRRRKEHVGGDRCADHHFDIHRVGIGLFEQVEDGFFAHKRGAQPFSFQDVAGLDADTRHDPFVGCIDHLAQLDIVQNVIGQICADASYCCGFLFCH